MGDLSRNFSRHEFECPDDTEAGTIIQTELVRRLQAVRDLLGEPIIITSGYRSMSYNKSIGGAQYSAHLTGYAADIKADDSSYRYRIIPLLFQQFQRVGIYANHIHVDADHSKIQEVCW